MMKVYVYIILIFLAILLNQADSLSCFKGFEVYIGSQASTDEAPISKCETNDSVCLSALLTIPQTDHTVSLVVKKCFNHPDKNFLSCGYLQQMLRTKPNFKAFLGNSSKVSNCEFLYCGDDDCNSRNDTIATIIDATQTTTSPPAVGTLTNTVIMTGGSSSTTSAGVRVIIAYTDMLILVIAGCMYSNSFVSTL